MTIKKTIPFALAIAYVLAGLSLALARLGPILELDKDIPKCDAILIGNVESISDEGLLDAQQELDRLKVNVKVEFPITGRLAKGQTFDLDYCKWYGNACIIALFLLFFI
jgi:hypothetical protein